MRPSVLVPAALLLCSCAKGEERPPAAKADSSARADSTSAPRAAVSTTKKTASESAAVASPKSASSSQTAAPPQSSSGSAKTAARTPTDTRCGVKGNAVLTDLGIGNLAIGRTVDAVKATCRIIRDIPELTSEGAVERVLTVVIGGELYRASVVNGLIGRVWVRTSRIATSDGLRVGTPLSRVAALKSVKIAEGEDGLYLLAGSHCGLSFRFSIQSRWPTGRSWTMEELIRTQGREPVTRILVTRCVRTPGAV